MIGRGEMINYMDDASLQALVDARRERLLGGAQRRQDWLASNDETGGDWRGIRQLMGRRFIQIGARLSGFANRGLCLSPNCDSEACVPV